MDDATLEQIREEDEAEDMGMKVTKKGHTDSIFTKENAISITRFVNDYLGINAPKGNLWHSGLRELNSRFVYGVDNEYANEHPERVFNGDLLLVIDDRGNRGTYINPRVVIEFMEAKSIEELYREIKKLQREGIQDLSKVDVYVNKFEALQNDLGRMRSLIELFNETFKFNKINQLKEEMNRDREIDEGIGGRKQ